MSRENKLADIRENPEIDVLVIGGGINGIGTFRDLALQGVNVLLVEKDDFCSGASAGSSHMLHGGIRYLENAEFRLVREALHERNRMFHNAPHYAKPLRTTIPIFRWFSGMLNAPLKFAGIMDKPAERGAFVIKIGLIMYDWYTRDDKITPNHEFKLRKSSLETFPKLNNNIVCTATYYDGLMPNPERICIDLLQDAQSTNNKAVAINYLGASSADKDRVTLIDQVTGEEHKVIPKAVVNAAGPWIDFVNNDMGKSTKFIGGTKGSHLILDHPDLLEACNGSEFFFENNDGRIVLILPYHNRVMVGTTDIRIDNPDEAKCTEDEVDYMLGMIPKVFPNIQVSKQHIVYQFTGVRPLPSSEDSRTGTISRDHSIRTIEAGDKFTFPIYSLVGGKWTSFRAFSEQTTDLVLQQLGIPRKESTKNLAIGGGKDYPTSDEAKQEWLESLHQKTNIGLERLTVLFERYGTRGATIADFIADGEDTPLSSLPSYSKRELMYLSLFEDVVHLDDMFQRRSLIAMLGYLSLKPDSIEEVAKVIASALQWDNERLNTEIKRIKSLLESKHGYKLS